MSDLTQMVTVCARNLFSDLWI